MNKQKIMDLPLNTSLDLEGIEYIKLRFSYDENYGYTWGCNTKQVINIWPMKNCSHVKYFKTLAEAKRNAIKRLLR